MPFNDYLIQMDISFYTSKKIKGVGLIIARKCLYFAHSKSLEYFLHSLLFLSLLNFFFVNPQQHQPYFYAYDGRKEDGESEVCMVEDNYAPYAHVDS